MPEEAGTNSRQQACIRGRYVSALLSQRPPRSSVSLLAVCPPTRPVSSHPVLPTYLYHGSTMKRPADMDSASPASPIDDAPSPASHASDSPAGPPRKRARAEVTPEERREARAHRNRIAAQNSRDRRKAQFAYLERRVSELEEENRQLRAGMGLTQLSRPHEQKEDEREKDRAREKENEELRERVKTLETGWEAVMKALAASGLPLSLPGAPTSTPSSSTSPAPNPSESTTSSQPPTTTFPVFVPPSPVFPISPAPSNSSSGSSTLFDVDDFDTTRHLARVATTDAPRLSSVSLQRVDLNARRIASSWTSTSPTPHTRRPSRSVRASPLPWTKSPWTTFSAKSLRLLPCRRRLLCLLALRPPGHDPSHSPRSSWRRPPRRR